jgi:hypothetical protein
MVLVLVGAELAAAIFGDSPINLMFGAVIGALHALTVGTRTPLLLRKTFPVFSTLVAACSAGSLALLSLPANWDGTLIVKCLAATLLCIVAISALDRTREAFHRKMRDIEATRS